jgi:hypothetical protein
VEDHSAESASSAPTEEPSTSADATEEKEEPTTEPPSVNNLKAIGIPHEEEPSSKAPTEFDDVAL